MLYNYCLAQIAMYLIVIPLVRLIFQNESLEYNFIIVLVFVIPFLLAGHFNKLKKSNKFKKNHIITVNMPAKFDIKILILILLIFVSAFISIEYELYNPRIGTENAALRASQVPPLLTIIFRIMGMIFPVILSIFMIDLVYTKKNIISKIVFGLILVGIFFIIGGGSSRIAFALFCIMAIIINQNLIKTKTKNKILKNLMYASVVVFLLVTFNRISSGDDRMLVEYFSAEILQRLDGLEIISKIIDIHGYSAIGINFESVINSVISSIPFLDSAIALKAEALTTVKAYILDKEFFLNNRDVNSFVILDVYYWGGIIGLVTVSYLIGWLSSLVDNDIGLNGSWIYNSFLLSVVINFTVLESEAIGLIIGIIRTWLIIMFFVPIIFKIKIHREIK